jgi:hypothetical protein
MVHWNRNLEKVIKMEQFLHGMEHCPVAYRLRDRMLRVPYESSLCNSVCQQVRR